MKQLKAKGIEFVVYKPQLEKSKLFNSRVETDFSVFKSSIDIILANRMVAELKDVKEKVFTRDLFGTN